MTSILKVQNIQYTDGDAALTIADGGGVTAASSVSVTSDLTVDTSTLKVDSSNNRVGVGLTDPSDLFEVSNSADTPTRAIITAEDSSGSDQNAFIKTKAKGYYYNGLELASTDGHVGFFGGQYSGGSATLQARVGGSGINSSDKLAVAIDSNGVVTKPNHPCFRASGLGGAWSVGINDVVHFANDGNGFNFDQGNNYNTSSNGFFAPVTGKYQFYAQALIQNGTNQKRIKLRHNGTDFAVGNVYGYNNSSEVTVWVSGIVHMAANDKIDVHLNTQSGNYYNNHPYTFFQGFLIG